MNQKIDTKPIELSGIFKKYTLAIETLHELNRHLALLKMIDSSPRIDVAKDHIIDAIKELQIARPVP